ncbi:MAG: ATP-binding protein, partial [Oscillospiraceae bacterium]|nr:ATP-binding protein [Oscillospiraceae bacterium]
TQLYLRGEKEYKRQKLTSLLTPEEREYIKNNPSVKFAAEYDNYPASIYNFREAEWQGVCFDVIAEVEELTGLTFKLVSDEYTQWPEILNMLENGEVSVISELIRTPDREGRFLWPETPLFSDLYALVSKSEQHKVNFNEVWISKVGVVTNSAQNEMFERWFPNHLYKKEYPGYEHAFFALQNDEVDLLMASRNQLMALTHYQEQAGYKTNIIFNYTLVSTFGFNINEVVLCSVVDKALRMTDTKGIADEWTGRTYDYRRQMADSRRPWVIGAVSSLGCLVVVLCFLIILMLRGRTTERLAIEANIREQSLISDNEALDRLNRMKNEFFENMSHDFKTPLNVISTSVFNVIDMCDFELDKTTVKEVLGNANHEIMLMARMVDSAMKYSDLQDDRKEMEPLDIAPLLREGAETYRALLERNGNKLSIDIPPALPLVLGNGDMLLHVLSNILSNSNRHTRDGEISVRAFKENGMITVTVRDNGAGIKPDILQRIFDRGVSDGGTGLGLSICKSAIEAHGGTISAESENLQGAVLTFTLPLYTGPNDKEHENG